MYFGIKSMDFIIYMYNKSIYLLSCMSDPDRNHDQTSRPPRKLPKLKTQQNQAEGFSPTKQSNNQSPTKFKKPRIIRAGYQIATMEKSIQHWNQMSYKKKYVADDGSTYYQEYSIFGDVSDLKKYGLGVYFYMEFIKRLLITCFIISVILVLQLYLNYFGQGLSAYKSSFTLVLAKFTIGNLSNADRMTYILQSVCDVMSMVVLFCFYLHWRSFHNQVVDEEQKDFQRNLNPSMYAVSVVGFDPKTPRLEEELINHYDSRYKGIYQVEVVFNFKRNFDQFIDYEQIVQEVEKEKQILRQTDKKNQKLIQLEKKLRQKQQQIAKIADEFDPIYAILHFRNLRAKYSFINDCKKYALINKLSYSIKRVLCCTPNQPPNWKFMKRDDIMIDNVNLPRPDQINWNNVDITSCQSFVRGLLSLVFIAISIFITSSLIALLTLYVTTSSNCGNFDSDTPFSSVRGTQDKLLTYCFCSANLASIYTNNDIGTFCEGLQTTILVNNIVQIAASLLSTVTNIILIVIVSVVAQKLLKPGSKPSEYNFIFICVFISNLINSTILPLFLNGDIFGFQSVRYLNFIKFINFNNVSIFKDFTRDWFAVISPYYTNFFIIASISPLIQIVVYKIKRQFVLWRLKKKCENDDPSNPTIQKQADQIICSFPIDLPTEMAVLCLQFFMCFMYSSLIPLAIPIFTLGLFLSFLCKRYIILNYTKRIPASESLNSKVITLIPFILLVHGLMGIWARTSEGIYNFDSFFHILDLKNLNNQIVKRALLDIVLLGATGLIALWIIFDFTIFKFFAVISDLCKDELQLPVSLAAVENTRYDQRLKGYNIVGSYKLENHPVFKLPYRAYLDLKKRMQQQKKQAMQNKDMGMEGQSSMLQINPYETQPLTNAYSTQPLNHNYQN